MRFTKAGIILFTENYEDCVRFYGEHLGLKKLHEIDREGERLTAFGFGDAYLMIETGGISHDEPKPLEKSPIKFRFNVADVHVACAELEEKGIAVEILEHSWGVTAEFHDPDGNRCALRSDAGFGV